MISQQLAALLNGREYGDEITDEECLLAKDNRLVVVFGYSDDNAEFRGAIHDEVGCYYGGDSIYLTKSGILPSHEDRCDCQFCGYEAAKKSAKTIIPLWGNGGYSWVYSTEIPHACFDIMEDGEKYCRGIVFSINDL